MKLRERLKSARQKVGFTQKEVSQRCGIDDSSLSSFECGRSEPRLAQLDKLAEVYHVALSYFFQESQERPQGIMWRNKPSNDKEIQAKFLQLCSQYRQLEIWTNELSQKRLPTLDTYSDNCWYPQVEEMASDARHAMRLGDRPGQSLYWILEEVYGVKIFHMELGQAGIAGCAVSDELGEAILLNRNCSQWRRNHDLAHELFHLLTWANFKHTEGIYEPTKQEEKFATCFAGNLLLPTELVRTAISKVTNSEGKVPFSKLDTIAREFDVSLESLFWRMHFLFAWDEEKTLKFVEKVREYVKSAEREDDSNPKLLPARYRALAIRALQNGDISLGRFAKFMGIGRTEARHYISGREPDYAEVPTLVA
ncbi:hypothetical protein ES703_42654 [subsurface metagenome]